MANTYPINNIWNSDSDSDSTFIIDPYNKRFLGSSYKINITNYNITYAYFKVDDKFYNIEG